METRLTLHALATWWDVLQYAKDTGYFKSQKDVDSVESFLHNPEQWQQQYSA